MCQETVLAIIFSFFNLFNLYIVADPNTCIIPDAKQKVNTNQSQGNRNETKTEKQYQHCSGTLICIIIVQCLDVRFYSH